jgi:hypothetical protein
MSRNNTLNYAYVKLQHVKNSVKRAVINNNTFDTARWECRSTRVMSGVGVCYILLSLTRIQHRRNVPDVTIPIYSLSLYSDGWSL